MLNFILVVASMGLLFGTAFPLGYILLSLLFSGRLDSQPFIIRLPIYLGIGLAISCIIMNAICFFYATPLLLYGLSIASFVYLLYGWLRRGGRLQLPRDWRRHITSRKSFPIALFFCNILYFLLVAAFIQWPNPGDPYNHSILLSLILQNLRLPTNYLPLSSEILLYPIGFHSLAVVLVPTLPLYPAEALLALSACIVSLIPLLLYSAAYIKTKSISFSLIAYFSAFIIHPSGYMTKWLLGYFYNGTYPVLLGIIFILVFVILVGELPAPGESTQALGRLILLLGILCLATLLTYPSFIYLLLIFPLFWAVFFIKHLPSMFRRFQQRLRQLRWLPYLLIALIATICIAIWMLRDLLLKIVSVFVQMLASPELVAYHLDPYFFIDNVSGLVIIISILPAVYLLAKQQQAYSNIILCFFLYLIPIVLSLDFLLYQYGLSIILPERAVIPLVMLAWLVLVIAAHSFYSNIVSVQNPYHFPRLGKQHRPILRLLPPKRVTVSFFIALISIGIFLPPMAMHISFIAPRAFGWYPFEDSFQHDYAASAWIIDNVPDDALILNDLTFSGLFITSFRIKNVVFTYHGNYSRGIDCKRFWEQVDNETTVKDVIETHHIEYVFTTSIGYNFYSWRFGGNETIVPKLFTPTQYVSILQGYSFLELVFQSGNSAVFKVKTTTTKGWAYGETCTRCQWDWYTQMLYRCLEAFESHSTKRNCQ